MTVATLAQVFATMGRREDEIAAALDVLSEAGEATVAAGRVILSEEACAGPGRRDRPEPVPWIEGRLAAEQGCRHPRAAMEAEGLADGIRSESVATAIGDLVALGRIRTETDDLALRPDLCAARGERDWQVDRVLSLGRNSYQAVIGFLALERGCRVDTTDRALLRSELREVAQRQLNLGVTLSLEAEAALDLKVEQALADPGSAYRVEPGAIVARYCLP